MPTFKKLKIKMRSYKTKLISATMVCITAGVVFLCGCGQPVSVPMRICPGKQTVEQATESMTLARNNIQPIRAAGKLIYKEYDKGKRKHKETLDMKLFFYPPNRLSLLANSIAGEAIRLGGNDKDFWMRVKPELSSYWYGSRDSAKRCGFKTRLTNPTDLIEILFGAVNTDGPMNLTNKDGFDILTSGGHDDELLKKVYLDCCDYLIRKIEYLSGDGELISVVKLDDYTTGADGITIPRKVDILSYYSDEQWTELEISFKKVKPFDPSRKTLEGKLFERPGTKGFKNIYRLNENCEFVRQ